ncbi:hypothetical protein VMCG_06027 [Cytospora schulzeri]|uniref:Uncharacterized protein n=1 Tax=Cytospora schulzeri TaxID=448051 RepID=A0A423WGM7_9PEZI|nr:hypothetical protein VMCG_06027 [Valsa malicola]
MSSDSGFGDYGFTIDNNLTNVKDTTMPNTESGMSAFVPSSSAEDSSAVSSTTEGYSAEKPIMKLSTPENFTSEKSVTEECSSDGTTTENSAVEDSTAYGSATEECSSEESTTENSTAVECLTDLHNFSKLSPEICNKILDDVLPKLTWVDGRMTLTKTLEPPGIAQASKVLRQTALVMYYHEREFSIQVPRDEDSRNKVEGLQDDLMERWNHPPYPGHANEVKERLEEEAEEVAEKFEDCIEGLGSMGPVYYSFIESIRVWSGRFRINRDTFTCNWAPRSFIVGFKAFAGPPRHGQSRKIQNRINADGTLDWTDFNRVRMVYTKKLRSADGDFFDLKFEDVLLHPAVQHIVKEMCLLGAAKAPAMEWVEVMVEEWDAWWTRRELDMPDYEPDEVDELSPLPSAAASPLPSDNEWDEWEEEEEEEEEEPEEESEEESEHESEVDIDEESSLPTHGDESQD